MLTLAWALVNIALFLYFLLICLKATKFLRERIGLFAAVIFVIGILCSISSKKDDVNLEPNSNQIKTWNFAPRDNTGRTQEYTTEIALQKTITSTYELLIGYKLDDIDRSPVPLWANATQTGLISGTYWKPEAITVNKIPGTNNLEYSVNGAIDWKLFGLTLYSQSRHFQGVVPAPATTSVPRVVR